MRRYIALIGSEADGTYKLTFPDLPDLWCSGPDLDRLIGTAEPVLASYIDQLIEAGEPVAPPSTIEDLRRRGDVPAASIVQVISLNRSQAEAKSSRSMSGPSEPQEPMPPAWRPWSGRQAG